MADNKVEFKYRAEYAKSGRASCKACKTNIEKDVLRLAVLVQSHHFDGKVPNWYHHKCFFGKQKPTDTGDIESFESLKWEDQEKIKKQIAERANGGAPVAASGKKPTKRALKDAASKGAKDFLIEYAKSSRAMCRGCEIKIAKSEVRISKKDFESEDAMRYGGKDLWHHIECFAKLRNELEYFESGELLPGFVTLTKEDQKTVKDALPKIERVKVKDEVDGEPDAKKVKKEEKSDTKLLKKQNDLLFKCREMIKDMKRPELQNLLKYNKQNDESCASIRVDHLADCMAFGALLPCEVCKEGQLIFTSGVGYQCSGNLTEWTQCLKIEKAPKRKPFKIPKSLFDEYPDLKKYKCTVGERKIIFRDLPSSSSIKKENDDVDSGPKVERFSPLKNLIFFVIGKLQQSKEDLKRKIVKLGGTLSSTFDEDLLAAVISTEYEVEKCRNKMLDAKNAGIHVVPESFVEEVSKGGDVIELIEKLSIAPWGANFQLQARVKASNLKSASLKSEKSKSVFTKSVPTKATLKVKNGFAVDPDSGLEDVASVFVEKKTGPYNAVLSKTDIQSGHNSYYKLQLLVNDHSKKYYVFRSWGRIGTTIGNTKTDNYSSLDSAKKDFFLHFREKTGNDFEDKDNFEKKPGRYNPVDIVYGDETDSDMQLSLKSDIPSKLHSSVQNLVSLLFDVEVMKKVMMEFELDLEKMPLGKLSKKQIQKAFSVLSELQKKDGDIKPAMVIDGTNRFYTLIPHSFGVKNPPPLDNQDIIKSKIEMLESLMEMETAYNILKESKGEDDEIHPIDKHYAKLNTHVEVIEKDSEEFALIDTYVKNTHGETHKMYELEIVELFKVKRQGEEKRFKPFKKLHNRKLLWHGSRITNFAGILSQGLRIAPPEAPVTGYMFGKGIYFADMVSKSANYCMTSRGNNVGLLLLCEVALGDMYERTHAEYVEKLPSGKHSTKGVGVTSPNPDETVKLDDGLEVPVGKGIKVHDSKNTSLLYNEYIVYDPAQVKARYLLKTKFNYKY